MIPIGARTLEIPWLFLDVHVLLDPVGLAFLASTLAVWLVAGWSAYASLGAGTARGGFIRFFLLAFFGAVVVSIAGDPITFLVGYGLVGLCTVPLVAYDRTPDAVRSARTYLAYVVLGEGFLLAAALLAWTPSTGATFPLAASTPVMALLMLIGLGVKAGTVGLHVWMPAAYRSAPAPGAAALAGGTIGLGILGFMRFGLFSAGSGIPAGAWIGLGTGGTLYGVLRGLTRSEPEHVLAYSSVSQMGVAFTVLAAGGAEPSVANGVLLAATAFVVHHAFVKTSLFLGVGLARSGAAAALSRPVAVAGLALPALALAGLPLSSGALAKTGLASAVHSVPWMTAFLTTSSVLTTVLVLHFLRVTRQAAAIGNDGGVGRGAAVARGAIGPWLTSVALVLFGVWLWPPFHSMAHSALEPGHILTGALPLALGGLVWMVMLRAGVADLLQRVPESQLARRLADRFTEWLAGSHEARPVLRRLPATTRRRLRHLATRFEASIETLDDMVGTWTLTGTLFLVVLLALRALL